MTGLPEPASLLVDLGADRSDAQLLGQAEGIELVALLPSIRALALVSTTCECSRLPLGPIVATVQLDDWASSPIYLSSGVLLRCWGNLLL